MILQDDSIPRNEWKLARVVEAHPSAKSMVQKLQLLISDTRLDKGEPLTRSVYPEMPIHKVVSLLEANSHDLKHFIVCFHNLFLKENPTFRVNE